MKFVKDFKYIVALIAAITFLLITMFITIRQVKRLPLSYIIQILDNQGKRIYSQTYDFILEGMKLQKVMLAFTETCIDNNSTNSGSLVFEKRMLKTKNTFLRMVFDLYECMWCSVLVHEDRLIVCPCLCRIIHISSFW
jgi:hypothetical protein